VISEIESSDFKDESKTIFFQKLKYQALSADNLELRLLPTSKGSDSFAEINHLAGRLMYSRSRHNGAGIFVTKCYYLMLHVARAIT
jgi:hypothetical protein